VDECRATFGRGVLYVGTILLGDGGSAFGSPYGTWHTGKGEPAYIRAFFAKHYWYIGGNSRYLGGEPDHTIYNWQYINFKNEVITINTTIFDERKYKDVWS
jgi:hypothetical protein